MPPFVPYLILLVISFGAGLSNFRTLSKADRLICLLLALTIIQESAATFMRLQYHNNFPTFHIYTPIEVSVIILYFFEASGLKYKLLISSILIIVSISLSIINTIFFQPYNTFNSYFLLYEGCVVVSLSLMSFFRLLLRDDIVPSKMVQFWLSMCFLIYWSLAFVDLGMFSVQISRTQTLARIFTWVLYSSNLLFYIGIAGVFIFYKKLIPSGE